MFRRDYRETPEYLAITGQINANQYLALYGDVGEILPVAHAGVGRSRPSAKRGVQGTGAVAKPDAVPPGRV